MNAADCGSRRIPMRGWMAVWFVSLLIGGGMFAAQAAGTAAQMISPAQGSTFTNATVTFTWDAGTGVIHYALWVGSKADGFDLYARMETGLSRTLTLPVDGRAIYVTLWSWINGKWEKNSYTFTAYTGPLPVAAQMVSPTDGSTFTNRMVTFTWDGGIGVNHIALWVGSTAKSFDLYVGLERGLSRTVRLPVDGRPIYVTLWSWINGKWESHAYSYTAYTQPGLVKAKITSPTNGSNLTSTSLELTWDAGEGVRRYALWVGSRPMGFDLYARFETGFSRTITVPADGRTIYVTLWSFLDGYWQSNSYTYTAPSPAKAEMTDPTSGSILPSDTVTFNWDAGTGVSKYALWVGSRPSSYDLFSGYKTTRSATLTLPKDGRALFVTLWSLINGKWESNSYLYKAYTSGLTLFGYGINDWFFDGRNLTLLPGWRIAGSSNLRVSPGTNIANGGSSLTGVTVGGSKLEMGRVVDYRYASTSNCIAFATLRITNNVALASNVSKITGGTLSITNTYSVGTIQFNTNALNLISGPTSLSNISISIGSGSLVLASNTFTGPITNFSGTVILDTNGTLRFGTNSLLLASGSNILSGGLSIVGAGQLTLVGGITNTLSTLTLSTNSILHIGTNTLFIINGSNTVSGTIAIGTGAIINLSATNSGGGVLILNP